jgi:hypothetical protein
MIVPIGGAPLVVKAVDGQRIAATASSSMACARNRSLIIAAWWLSIVIDCAHGSRLPGIDWTSRNVAVVGNNRRRAPV